MLSNTQFISSKEQEIKLNFLNHGTMFQMLHHRMRTDSITRLQQIADKQKAKTQQVLRAISDNSNITVGW